MSDNLYHRHHGNIPGNMTADQQFSFLNSNALDCLGFNQDMFKYRVAFWKIMDSIMMNKEGPNRLCDYITAGSQAEGVVSIYGSDTDRMIVDRDTICTDKPFSVIGDRKLNIFQTVNHDTAPGYTQLKLVKLGNFNDSLKNNLVLSDCGDSYISSVFYINALMVNANEYNRKYTTKTLTKTGPAMPIYNPITPDIVNDAVLPFKCHCPALLGSLQRRPRRYNWPPRSVRFDISQMDAHVVPVGCKSSDTYNQEWRICFTNAEIHLIQCLNDTQTKLYIVLKMISKQLLKSLCSEITSYIMKNIVLWMCEYLSNDSFTDKQLGIIIIQAFVFLKKCLTKNYLPSYMIPERNLFNGRIEPEEKLKLTETLSTLIEEGLPAVFKRIDKLRDSMLFVHRAPEMAAYSRIKRDLVEKICLLQNVRRAILAQPDMSDEERQHVWEGDELCVTLEIAVLNLVQPEWRTLVHRGVDFLKIKKMYEDKLKIFLS